MLAKKPVKVCLCLTCLVLLSLMFYGPFDPRVAARLLPVEKTITSKKPTANRTAQYARLPLQFEQAHTPGAFRARGHGYSLLVSGTEALLKLRAPEGRKGSSTCSGGTQAQTALLKMMFIGASEPHSVAGLEPTAARSHYFIGNDPRRWRTNVAGFARVRYEAVYPGIDLVWYGNQENLEYDLVIAPGADAARIRLAFAGAAKIEVDPQGDLNLRAGGGELKLRKPQAWQEVGGGRRDVACSYRVAKTGRVEFQLGPYDATRELVIDPALAYSSLIGGAGPDEGFDIAVDAQGAAYVTGRTLSADFPVASPLQASPAAPDTAEVFITKINPTGSAIVYSTYLGGDGNDTGTSIAVDAAGNAYICGYTDSTNFPTTAAAPQRTRAGLVDSFVAKLNPAGSSLIYSTLLGGNSVTQAAAIAVDAGGAAYVAGQGDSTDFPSLNLANVRRGSSLYRSANAGADWIAFGNGMPAVQINALAADPKNPALVYAGGQWGFYKSVDGGATWTQTASFAAAVSDIFIDPVNTGTLYVLFQAAIAFKSTDAGNSFAPFNRPPGLFSLLAFAIDPKSPSTLYAGGVNGASKSVDGGMTWQAINNGLMPPGVPPPVVLRILVDPTQTATLYITTATNISNGIFKSTNGGASWAAANTGLENALTLPRNLTFNPQNAAILYASSGRGVYKSVNGAQSWTAINNGLTPAGQSNPVAVNVVAVDPAMTQVLYAGTLGFGVFKSVDGGANWAPANNGLNNQNVSALLVGAADSQRVLAGTAAGSDAFAARLNPAGSQWSYFRPLGGFEADAAVAIAVDAQGAAYLTGTTVSSNFPVLNAVQAAYAGNTDGFVTKLNAAGQTVYSTYLGGELSDQPVGIGLDQTGTVVIAGTTLSRNFPLVAPFRATPAPGVGGATASDGFVTKLNPQGSAWSYSSFVGGTNSSTVTALAVAPNGEVFVAGLNIISGLPLVAPIQPTPQNGRGSYIQQLNASGTALLLSSFFGAGPTTPIASLALDAAGNLYLTASGSPSTFPTLNPIPLPGTNRGTDVLVAKISAQATDLAIAMTDRPDPVKFNNNLAYDITVTNNGPAATTGVVVSDTLPEGVTLVSADASQGGCGGTRTVVCQLGNLAAGAKAGITLLVTPSVAGTLVNRASVTGDMADSDTANNTAEQQTKVSTLPSIFGRIIGGDGQPLGGGTVSLFPPFRATATASDGTYQFAELAEGATYIVVPTKPGFAFAPVNREFSNLMSDQRADFTAISCTFTVTPIKTSFQAVGGAGSAKITANDARCSWTARSTVPWVRLLATAGPGNDTLNFTVDPTTAARRGTIIIADQVITVRQEFNACPQAEFQSLPMILGEGVSAVETPHLLVADFNGDGRGDPAVQTFSGGGVTVAFSRAGGYDTKVFAAGGLITALATGDFNRDGKPDLALVRSDRVLVLLNTSSAAAGDFAAPVEVVIGQTLGNVFTGDFNQDGNTDLAVSSISGFPPIDQNVVVVPGNGAGGFGAPITTRFRQQPGDAPRLQPGDFNGDGRLDFAAIDRTNEIVILRGNGAGGFELMPGVAGDGVSKQVPNQLAAGDFNGDGRDDLVVLRPSTDPLGRGLGIYLSTPAGGFEPARNRSLLNDGWIGGLLAADLNSDGRAEALVLNRNGLEVVTTSADGTPAAPAGYFTGPVKAAADPGAPLTLAVGDFNGDGRTDVFAPVPVGALPNSVAPAALVILVGTVGGGFVVPRSFPLVETGEPPTSTNLLAVADFNGDRISDLLVRVTRGSSADVAVRFGDGAGGFGAPVLVASNVVVFGTADYNRDGKADIAAFDPPGGTLTVYGSDGGTGIFKLSGPTTIGANARLLAGGDFTGDGIQDFLISNASGVRLLAGAGNGAFNDAAASVSGGLTNVAFTPGDFNGDGNLDLLAVLTPTTQGAPTTVTVLFGDGQGHFAGDLVQAVIMPQPLLRVADFNNDGKADLAITTLANGQGLTPGILVAFSRGNGQFGPGEGSITHDVFLNAPELQTLATGDVNSDGFADVIATTRTTSQLLLFTAQSDGQFRPTLSLPAGAGNPLAFTGDFNGDGATDVLLASATGAGNATLLINRGVCAPAGVVTLTSAASFSVLRMATESIAAAFGANLASDIVVATTTPLPTSLGGTTLRIRDSAGNEADAPLFFVSPTQINLLVPRGLANGPALVTVLRGGNAVTTGVIEIVSVNPGLISADATGTGYAAAVVLRVKADGSQVFEPVVQFNAAQNRFDPVPIDVGNPAEQVFVLLFGTGIRNRTSLANVATRVGGEAVETLYAGDQGGFAGLDQLNVRLPSSLAGKGDVAVDVMVDGKVANPVRLRIR